MIWVFPRADVRNKKARSGRRPFFFDGFYQIGVLGKRTPNLPSGSGDRSLHHLRTGKQISTESVDERRTDPIPLPVVQHVKVFKSDIATEKPLDHILVLVVPLYGVQGYLERFVSVDVGLKLAEKSVLP